MNYVEKNHQNHAKSLKKAKIFTKSGMENERPPDENCMTKVNINSTSDSSLYDTFWNERACYLKYWRPDNCHNNLNQSAERGIKGSGL